MTSAPSGGRRETRLLLATIAVSIGMLLLLARFRFPEEAGRQAAEPAPAPLERLAARATYEELAAVMADLERRILPSIVPLATQGEDGLRFVPAVRISADRAVAILGRERRPAASRTNAAPRVLLRDPDTELIVVEVSPDPGAIPLFPAGAPRPGPRYVAAAEAAGGVAAIRPVYIGRVDPVSDARWPDALVSIAGLQQVIPVGAAVFSLEGMFLGLATESGDRLSIVRAATLRNAATTANGTEPARDGALPIEVESLTASLAKAAGADKGVMVSYVSPAASQNGLASGDVIQAVDGTEITSVAGFRQLAATRKPGATVALSLVRRGEPRKATIVAVDDGVPAPLPAGDFGAALRSVGGVGSEVITVQRNSAADRAGLRQGDIIIAIDANEAPDVAAIARAFRAMKPQEPVLLTVRRGTDHRVLALEKR
jgi:membrane-associated protease RseP (regulator of RpoE activity)